MPIRKMTLRVASSFCFRIRGTQIMPSNDSGTKFVTLSEDDPRVYEDRPKITVVDMESEDISGYMMDFQGSDTS